MSTFSFAPSNEIYGSCVLSLAEVEGYYTEETVTVGYRSVLSFVLPKSGTLVSPGTTYDIQVVGTSGTSSVSVSVVGICQVGGSFTENVQLGVKTQVTWRIIPRTLYSCCYYFYSIFHSRNHHHSSLHSFESRRKGQNCEIICSYRENPRSYQTLPLVQIFF
jgi:hypothetical protein